MNFKSCILLTVVLFLAMTSRGQNFIQGLSDEKGFKLECSKVTYSNTSDSVMFSGNVTFHTDKFSVDKVDTMIWTRTKNHLTIYGSSGTMKLGNGMYLDSPQAAKDATFKPRRTDYTIGDSIVYIR